MSDSSIGAREDLNDLLLEMCRYGVRVAATAEDIREIAALYYRMADAMMKTREGT